MIEKTNELYNQEQSDLKVMFHKRAGESQEEFRKLVISLSTASLGVLFLILTGEQTTLITSEDRKSLFYAITLMGLAIFWGVLAWQMAGRLFYVKAEKGPKTKGVCHILMTVFDMLLLFFFITGIGASGIYLYNQLKVPKAQEVATSSVSLTFQSGKQPALILTAPNLNQRFGESDSAIRVFREEVKKLSGIAKP